MRASIVLFCVCALIVAAPIVRAACDPSTHHCECQADGDFCKTCDDEYIIHYRDLSNNLLLCGSGPGCEIGFVSEGSYICRTCEPKCAECSGDPASCTECATGFIRVVVGEDLVDCVANCPIDQFNNGGTCAGCSPLCFSCENQATECKSCKEGDFFIVEGKTCKPCDTKCAKCDNAASCTVCATGMIRVVVGGVLKDCVASCPDGQFNNGGTCADCSAPCATCENLATECKSCKDDHFLDDSACRLCDNSCDTCETSASHCTGCSDGHFLTERFECAECDPKCATCETDALKCLTCAEGWINVDTDGKLTDCIESCGPHQFVSDSNTCEDCDQSCVVCEGAAGHCTACNGDEFVDEGNQCVSCDKEKCELCFGYSTNCTKCAGGKVSLYDKEGVDRKLEDCIASCDTSQAFYAVGEETCVHCDALLFCGTCRNGASCDTCDATHTIPVHAKDKLDVALYCADVCPGYTDAGSQKCVDRCTEGLNCQTCENGESCHTCADDDLPVYADEASASSGSGAVLWCNVGATCKDRAFAYSVSACLKLPDACFTGDETGCVSCAKGWKGANCTVACAPNEFCPDGDSMAIERQMCAPICFMCDNDDATNGRTMCTSCVADHFFDAQKHTCVPCAENTTASSNNTAPQCQLVPNSSEVPGGGGGLQSWEIAVIAVGAVAAVALVVGLGFAVSYCVKKKGPSIGVATASHDVLFDDGDDVVLSPVSKKGKKNIIAEESFI